MGSDPDPRDGGVGCPAVSIGLPVFNGEQHLVQALNSLLSQTDADFELLISDNCSTDSTEDICRHFVRHDARVRYFRQAQNIGAPRNWNYVVCQARGTYFKWASANDYCNEHFIEDCRKVLEDDPAVVLSFGKTYLVDDAKAATTEYMGDIEVLDARPRDRFRQVTRAWALNNAQSGLIRLNVLRQTGLDRPYAGGDLVLMAELALHGRFRRAPAAVLYRRIGEEFLSARLSQAQLEKFIDPLAASGRQLVAWPRNWDRMAMIVRAPIDIREKLACMGIAAQGASWDRVRLAKELPNLLRSSLQK